VGGNYVRCTMSSRDEGDVWPFERDPATGLYDLRRPGVEYWQRFERFLKLAAERDIVAQVELWDRFDFVSQPWQRNPYNSRNNVNYTASESGLKEEINTHAGLRENGFFRSVPALEDNPLVLAYQRAQVDELLSRALPYGNVLYCINNETNESPEWGRYWIEMIQERAAREGAPVYTTDMFDDGYKGDESEQYPVVFDQPDIYTFVDVSQVNSRNFHEIHWLKMRWMVEQAKRHPRPANNVKVYGGGHAFFGTGGLSDGVERFWRDLIGGCASARFHRPPSGNGLNGKAQASIRAARKLEDLIKLWDVEPHIELLVQRPDEVYVAARPGEAYVLYFADGGAVGLDLAGVQGRLRLRWISVASGEWGGKVGIEGGEVVSISAPGTGGWIAAIARARN
jgi:hypothetical protein